MSEAVGKKSEIIEEKVKSTILLVEDDDNLRKAVVDTIELAGFNCIPASNGKEALLVLQRKKIDMIVTDIRMDGLDGHMLLKKCRKEFSDVPVIMITAHATVEDAVEAMQTGAVDYIAKPFEPDALIKKIESYIPATNTDSASPIAEDPRSIELLALAKRVAKTDVTILLSGNSGTGKEVLARYLHRHSTRSEGPFVAINCAAIPESMLESILFGHEKGAFTGAHKATPGKFEHAQGGTLLLDEISEMPLALQAKLLRVLQEREVERVGSRTPIDLDVRILATTNRDLREEVEEGRFREDLYYRLNVFPLSYSPLRERKKDILPLFKYLVEYHTKGKNRVVPTLTKAAEQALLTHDWPGNAREMDNVVQRALILQNGELIEVGDLQLESSVPNKSLQAENENSNSKYVTLKKESLSEEIKSVEMERIISTVKSSNTRREAAEKLGVSERTLRSRLSEAREAGMQV